MTRKALVIILSKMAKARHRFLPGCSAARRLHSALVCVLVLSCAGAACTLQWLHRQRSSSSSARTHRTLLWDARHHSLCTAAAAVPGPALVIVGDEFGEELSGGHTWLDGSDAAARPPELEALRRTGIALSFASVARELQQSSVEPRLNLAMWGDSAREVAARLRSCSAFPRAPELGVIQIFLVIVGSHELSGRRNTASNAQSLKGTVGASRRFVAAVVDIVATIRAHNPESLVLLQPPLPLPAPSERQARGAARARFDAIAALETLAAGAPRHIEVLGRCAAVATTMAIAAATNATAAAMSVEEEEAAAEEYAGYYGTDSWEVLPTLAPTDPPLVVPTPKLDETHFEATACRARGLVHAAGAAEVETGAGGTHRDREDEQSRRERCVLSVEGYRALLECWRGAFSDALERRRALEWQRYRERSGELPAQGREPG